MRLEALSSTKSKPLPIYLVTAADLNSLPDSVPLATPNWIRSTGFAARNGELCLVPEPDGKLACALFGVAPGANPMDAGALARLLPAGDWRMAGKLDQPHLAALGFLLGAYRYDRYRKGDSAGARLVLPENVDRARITSEAEAAYLARDLINTPANDCGPAELEAAVRDLAKRHKARVTAIRGDDLLKRNFPMVHAVGRASAVAPRIIDMRWGSDQHPKVTLVGKGVCFDTGGLNIKPGESMLLMKKDMGGAANLMGLAHMIMAARLPVRLRLIIGAVENSISANAFRPGDILPSRKGLTVEIGNTDAEGRLVLADALAWGDEEKPEIMVDMATLTGAARVALGTDLPAMFCNDDGFAGELTEAGTRQFDPLWRMPLWKGYASNLSSQVADLGNIAKGSFAGSIMAALFLERFISNTKIWAHFDIFAWNNSAKSWGPAGGETFAIRALFHAISGKFPA